MIGCGDIISKIQGFQRTATGMRAQGLDPRESIPTSFVFKGPPGMLFEISSRYPKFSEHSDEDIKGTGKTTTARKFGKIYYDLGLLSNDEVVEISASDLVAEYTGQTGPKTIKQLEKGLGRVLFIDEAYRLSEGKFAREAIDELVDQITKPKFAGKLIIILAGYDEEMNALLQVNPGLNSRFANEIIFVPLDVKDCLKVLELKLKHSNIAIPSMQNPKVYKQIFDLVTSLSKIKGWANARDISTLAQNMTISVYQNITERVEQLEISSELALECTRTMLYERKARQTTTPGDVAALTDSMEAMGRSQAAPASSSNTSTHANTAQTVGEPNEARNVPVPSTTPAEDPRDLGVSDEIWIQLQVDKQHAILREEQLQDMMREKGEHLSVAEMEEEKASAAARSLRGKQGNSPAEARQLQQENFAAKLREKEMATRRRAAQAELQVLQRKYEEEKKKEAETQKKCQQIGKCPQGYRWIKQAGGYRCAGGSHWIRDSEL